VKKRTPSPVPGSPERSARWRTANLEAVRAAGRAYYAAHREERLAYSRSRPKERTAYAAAYHATHREEKAAYQRAHYAAHRAEKAAYQAAHREEIAARHAARYLAHREEAMTAAKAHYASFGHPKQRGAEMCGHAACLALGAAALAWQTNSHVCYICGTPVWQGVNLEMDHVHPVSRGGLHCADNLRPACGPCNRRKHNKVAA
jgi:5-methylcytosine-specific restriction endonuclease McrA